MLTDDQKLKINIFNWIKLERIKPTLAYAKSIDLQSLIISNILLSKTESSIKCTVNKYTGFKFKAYLKLLTSN